MNNEEFKNKVRTILGEAGILIAEDESVFSTEKIIQNEADDSLMLVTPDRSVWIWLGTMMPDTEFASEIKRFIDVFRDYVQNSVKTSVGINPNVSVKEYLESLSKMFGGKAPTTKIGTAKLADLVNEAMTPANG